MIEHSITNKYKTTDAALRATWLAIARMYNEEAAKFDSTMATAYTLLNLKRHEGIPSTVLAPKMGMEGTSMSRILKNMEERNVIYREKNPEDGRSMLIHLTPEGVRMRQVAKNYVLKFNQMIEDNVSPEKMKHFLEVLEVINQLVEKERELNKPQ